MSTVGIKGLNVMLRYLSKRSLSVQIW